MVNIFRINIFCVLSLTLIALVTLFLHQGWGYIFDILKTKRCHRRLNFAILSYTELFNISPILFIVLIASTLFTKNKIRIQ